MGTVKKSMETSCETWLSRNVRQVGEGAFPQRSMYLVTLLSPMSMPSNRQLGGDNAGVPASWIAAIHRTPFAWARCVLDPW